MSRLGNELSLESRPLSRLSTHNTSSETNVVVAWLERFEDRAQFPVDELLMEFDFSQNVGQEEGEAGYTESISGPPSGTISFNIFIANFRRVDNTNAVV